MTASIEARNGFAFCGPRTGAALRVRAVGLDSPRTRDAVPSLAISLGLWRYQSTACRREIYIDNVFDNLLCQSRTALNLTEQQIPAVFMPLRLFI
jgi:hypothetical protein